MRLQNRRLVARQSQVEKQALCVELARVESFLTSLLHGRYTARAAQTSNSTPATVMRSHSLSRQLSGLGPSI